LLRVPVLPLTQLLLLLIQLLLLSIHLLPQPLNLCCLAPHRLTDVRKPHRPCSHSEFQAPYSVLLC
jgi:hypothetical protein